MPEITSMYPTEDMSQYIDTDKVAAFEANNAETNEVVEVEEKTKKDLKKETTKETKKKPLKATTKKDIKSGEVIECKTLFKDAKWHKSMDYAHNDMMQLRYQHLIKFTNYQFAAIPSIRKFAELVFLSKKADDIPKYFHECIFEDKEIKLFADLDLGNYEEKLKENSEKYKFDNIINEFLRLMQDSMESLFGIDFDIDKCLWQTSTKKSKLSIHFIYDGFYFKNREELKLFWLIVRKYYLCDINYEFDFDFDYDDEREKMYKESGDKKYYEPLLECIDFNCYNKNHTLRTVYSTKTDDKNRILNPFILTEETDENDEIIGYTKDTTYDYKTNKITDIDELVKYFITIDKEDLVGFANYKRLQFNEKDERVAVIRKQANETEARKSLAINKKCSKEISKRSLEQINFILLHVSEERSELYEYWSLAMYAIKYYADALGDKANGKIVAHNFSKRSKSKYNKGLVDEFYNNVRNDAEGQIKIGTLVKWLENDNTEAYIEMIEEYKEKPIDISNIKIDSEEKYLYIDFVREFENKTFSSKMDMINTLRTKAPKVLARILKGEGSYIKKDDNDKSLYSIINKNGLKKSFKISYMEQKTKKEETVEFEKNVRFEDIVDECINMYKITDVMPNIKDNDKDTFNLWRGFVAKLVGDDSYNESSLDIFLNFIKEIICNNNAEHYEIVLNWLAAMVQNPCRRIPIYLLLVGGQGIGKSTFTEFIRKYVIGYKVSSTQSTIDDALGQWNGWSESCVLDIIEELPTLKNGGDDRFNKFKEMVSGETLRINNKNINPYEVRNLLHIIINTNHKYSMACEKDDRRCFALEINEKYKIIDSDKENNTEKYAASNDYWNKIHKACYNQEFGNMFFTYLMKFNVNYDKLKKAPITDLKQEIIDSNKCNAIVYVEELKQMIKNIYEIGKYDENDEYKLNNETEHGDNDKLISMANNKFWKIEKKTSKIYATNSDIYSNYIKWCEQLREKPMSNIWFFRNISSLLTKHKKETGFIYYM